MTGYTLVIREPEWDDRERDRMLGLGVYEASICECGFHESLVSDKSNVFTFDDRTCTVCLGAAQYGRMLAAQDKKAMEFLGEDLPPMAPRPSDGRRTFIRQMSPLEVAQRQESRASHSQAGAGLAGPALRSP